MYDFVNIFTILANFLTMNDRLRLGKIATQSGDQYGHFTDEVRVLTFLSDV